MDRHEEWMQLIYDAGIDLLETDRLPPNYMGCYFSNGSHPIVAYKKQKNVELTCTLAEEYAHHLYSIGDGSLDNVISRKNEAIARSRAYHSLIDFDALASALNNGLRNIYELAEYLNVSEGFLRKALIHFDMKYERVCISDEFLYFNPLRLIPVQKHEVV